jgi:hypothetical protein
MKEDKLNRLKEVLSVPTKSRNETLMIEYLKKVLDEKGYDYTVDRLGNVYVTKGEAEYYPCFISHTDTVHEIDHGLTVIETKDKENGITILTGVNKDTLKPSGIGGDDKCGVFLCLEMLDTYENVKAAFFVSEEIGCVGSRIADPEFFSNVGYAIQYDSPENDSMSYTLMGKNLFETKSEFGEKVSGLIIEHGIKDWAHHPYTDIWQLLEKFDFSCLNLAAGYYNMHRANEYVIVEDVENAYNLGLEIVSSLGEAKYERPKPEPKEKSGSWWNGYSSRYDSEQAKTKKELINEDVDDESEEEDFESHDKSSDIWDLDETKIISIDDPEWKDFWDYDEFNGGSQCDSYYPNLYGRDSYDW